MVDEDDFCKFGRIGLEIILPSPLSDMVELSLSAAVVCSMDDDVRIVSELELVLILAENKIGAIKLRPHLQVSITSVRNREVLFLGGH